MSIFVKNNTSDTRITFKVGNDKYSLNAQEIEGFSDDEYIEIDDVLNKNAGLVVVDQLEHLLSYSLTEQDTGSKWIDGQTIYRKAFVVSAQVDDNQLLIPIGATVDAWVRTGGFVKDGTETLTLPVPIPNATAGVVGVAIRNSGIDLQIHTGGTGAHDGGVVWIEYTKAVV